MYDLTHGECKCIYTDDSTYHRLGKQPTEDWGLMLERMESPLQEEFGGQYDSIMNVRSCAYTFIGPWVTL